MDKAIEDLNFKVIAEKLKKEPINADTIITPETLPDNNRRRAGLEYVSGWNQTITVEQIKASAASVAAQDKCLWAWTIRKLITF